MFKTATAKGGSKYETANRGEEERREEGSEVRAQAARQCVRQLRLHPVLGVHWLGLVDSLEQLSRLAQLESLIPTEAAVGEQKGRVTESDGTLWDQAAHEDAIRILVEEAKVNVCLRMMIEFKEWQFAVRGPTAQEARLKDAARAMDVDEVNLLRKCNLFEESLGLLLLRGFMHVETLQLTDCVLLLEHVAMILSLAHERVGEYKETLKSQESVVIYYFTALMKHSEALNNSEVLAKTKELRVVHLVVRHMLQRKDDYALDFLGVAVEGFAKLAENEDFLPQWKEFFATKEEMEDFLKLQGMLEDILKRYPDKKAEMRPLSDLLKKVKKAAT
ncbi:unnamed protein product [Amoebophrya sp. A25]|nr:unnamed protein product [Amoebophrya sp. A25]|eukprot:GSA25T00000083001.1